MGIPRRNDAITILIRTEQNRKEQKRTEQNKRSFYVACVRNFDDTIITLCFIPTVTLSHHPRPVPAASTPRSSTSHPSLPSSGRGKKVKGWGEEGKEKPSYR